MQDYGRTDIKCLIRRFDRPAPIGMGALLAIATSDKLTLSIVTPQNGSALWVQAVTEVTDAVPGKKLPPTCQSIRSSSCRAVTCDRTGLHIKTDFEGTATTEHTTLLQEVGQDDTHFHVLGGNQSDAVTVARIAKPRLLNARWPARLPRAGIEPATRGFSINGANFPLRFHPGRGAFGQLRPRFSEFHSDFA